MIYRPSIFSKLLSFSGFSFMAMDEFHTISHGAGKHIYQLITIDLDNKKNQHFFYLKKDKTISKRNYPFLIKRSELKKLGESITSSRKNIPVSFQGSFDNFIGNTEGVRAVDWQDFLLYIVPTLVVPLISSRSCQKALLALVRGCALALQWNLDKDMLVEMRE